MRFLTKTSQRKNSFRFPEIKVWKEVLLITAGLYVLGLVVLILTQNPNLFPTVVLVGSFAVPVAFVTFFWENQQASQLSLPDVALSFLYGGTLSVLLAGILEPIFIQQLSLTNLFGAAGIEELTKIAAVVILSRRLRHQLELDGILLGVAVGMGFAALESAGFSFTAFLESGGSLSLTVLLTLFRALLAPAGHGTWTAILAAILFLESAPYRFRLTEKVILAYLGVTVLHGFWNGLPLLAEELNLAGFWVFFGQLVIAAVGLLVLYLLWEEAKRRARI